MHKFYHYCAASLLMVAVLIGKEAYSKQQFYTTVVSLTTSKVSRVSLYNAALVLLILLGQGLQKIFLGELKPREEEKVGEQTFYFVVTTCLTLTIFREHMTSLVLSMFVMCLFVKIFHWLAQSREEYIEQTEFQDDQEKLLQYFRLISLLTTLGSVDLTMSAFYIWYLIRNGASLRLLLALEFVVMTVTLLTVWARLGLHVVDTHYHHRWESKGKYKFYLEIFSDLLQCVLYMAFFLVILYCYGIPIHLIRELMVTFRSFKKTIADFIRYRQLVACLDERYPNATEEEIARDPQCIICYDDMAEAKKLPCGHIFHKHCLKSWMERNRRCPYCNKETLLDPPPAPPRPAPPAPAAAPTPPTATPPSGGLRARGAARAQARQQQLGLVRQQQRALEQCLAAYHPAWAPPPSAPSPAAAAPSPADVGAPQSASAAALPGAATSPMPSPATAPAPLTAPHPSAPLPGVGAESSAPHWGPGAPHAAVASGLPSGGWAPPYIGGGGGSAPAPAAPATPEQAEAYAAFHRQMGSTYADIGLAVGRIADAYTALAAALRQPGLPAVPPVPGAMPTPEKEPAGAPAL